jgi:hypothetical protein
LLRQGLTGQGLSVASSDQRTASVPPATGFRPFPGSARDTCKFLSLLTG